MGSSGSKPRVKHTPAQVQQDDEPLRIGGRHPDMWGWFVGLIVFALIAVPLSAAFAFATNPASQQLFAGRLSDTTTAGYQAFWWVVTLLLLALPVLVGYGIARMSGRALAIVGGVVVVFFIAILVLGQMFVF
jgi:amino acid transporter